MRFEHPYFLILFIPLILYLIWRYKKINRATVLFPDVDSLRYLQDKKTYYKVRIAPFVRIILLSLLILTLSKPQKVDIEKNIISKGVDIMLVVDTSMSMRGMDMGVDHRLNVSKRRIKEFIKMRTRDRLGLVIFAGQAFTQCPLTFDHRVLYNLLGDVNFEMVEDGTAIGMAVATAANRMKDSEAKSKVIVLLTDGDNNRGEISPLVAADMAKELGVKVYTIGVGDPAKRYIPVKHPQLDEEFLIPNTLNEALLKEIAYKTNARYFMAKDEDSLKSIYTQIDQLEKTEIKTTQYYQYTDYFPVLLWLCLFLLLFELACSQMFFLTIP